MRALAVLVVAALGTAGAYGTIGSREGPKRFSISGHVDDLVPGVDRTLRLRIRNPYRHRIRVVSVRTIVEPSGRPCPTRNIQVAPFRGSLAVRARSSRLLPVRVKMLASAPTTCAGAAFPLYFFGRAVRP